jgi:NAD(P)-dependent dehydrogenase (short-subunit alcohol dehydrogenase family)
MIMSLKLKPLHQQVIFITGATSGIGLATVRLAVNEGARVFMVARNEEELLLIQNEMRKMGHETAFAVADVAEEDQVRSAADHCIDTFGRIDTFINNAGISIYARVLDTETDEARRLFDTNFWGVVNGCNVAVPFMKEKGGVIINVGSVLSYIGLPVQGIYSASKHAVRGYTDTLRREIMAEKLPIQVTLIVPSAIDTPYPEHARSHIGEPVHKGPVYSTQVVAKAILKCAEVPTRELGIGAPSVIYPLMDVFFSKFHDFIMAKMFTERSQRKEGQDLPREFGNAGNLFRIPTQEGHEAGHYPGHVMRSSLWTQFCENKRGIMGGTALLGSLAWLYTKRMKYEAKSIDSRSRRNTGRHQSQAKTYRRGEEGLEKFQ